MPFGLRVKPVIRKRKPTEPGGGLPGTGSGGKPKGNIEIRRVQLRSVSAGAVNREGTEASVAGRGRDRLATVGAVGGSGRMDGGGVRRGVDSAFEYRGRDGSTVANRDGLCFGGSRTEAYDARSGSDDGGYEHGGRGETVVWWGVKKGHLNGSQKGKGQT